jgi:hypothetical protein
VFSFEFSVVQSSVKKFSEDLRPPTSFSASVYYDICKNCSVIFMQLIQNLNLIS